MRSALNSYVGLPKKSYISVAILDWTTVRSSVDLLSSSRGVREPFTALVNLGALVAAVIFYDRILVIPNDTGIAETLGLEEVIRGIPYEGEGSGIPSSSFSTLLEGHYRWAIDELTRASNSDVPPFWLTELKRHWKHLLPQTSFPSHDFMDGYQKMLRYNSPSAYEHRRTIFRPNEERWLPGRDLGPVILENDLKALFYERLAQTMQAMLSDSEREVEIRYVGGCLRSPMLLARAQGARAAMLNSASPEAWLQEAWAELVRSEPHQVRAPFWLQAVLASVKTPAEIPRVLAGFRRAATRYRLHRSEFHEAIFLGDQKVLSSRISALSGNIASLTKTATDAVSATVDIASASLRPVIPMIPPELIKAGKAAAGTQSTWLKKLIVRQFHPQIWIILNMSGRAGRATDIVNHAARLFKFQGKDAREPLKFLDRLGQTTWVS